MEALAREGLVVRQQGKGSFVTAPAVRHDLLELRGIYDGLVAQGLDPRTSLLELGIGLPPAAVAARLGTGTRRLTHWKRLYAVRGKPFAVSTVLLDAGRLKVTREVVDLHPTYTIFEKLLGERIGRADVAIRYEPASAEIARALGPARGAPLITM